MKPIIENIGSNMKYIITLTGSSQSGKTTIINKFENSRHEGFVPIMADKVTTRFLRKEEEKNEKNDVRHVDRIPEDYDLVYQQYGHRVGVCIADLIKHTEEGKTPIIVINDVMAVDKLKKECSRRVGDDLQVISIYVFSKIPRLSDFESVSKKRGNVSPEETKQRFEKANAQRRIFIENIHLFSFVILNVRKYTKRELTSEKTLIDRQIGQIISNVILKNKKVSRAQTYPKIFILYGNAASGKDELIRATNDLGKLYAKVIPKFTSRQQEVDDGNEMICQYIVSEEKSAKYVYMAQDLLKQALKDISKITELSSSNGSKKGQQNYFHKLKSELDKKIIDWREVFPWASTVEESKTSGNYISNPEYEEYIKQKTLMPDRYIVYEKNGNSYSIDIEMIRSSLEKNLSPVVVASDSGTIKRLEEFFGEDSLVLIYNHSQISKNEYLTKSKDATARKKAKEFEKELEFYSDNITSFNHVFIYAEDEIGRQKDGRQEDLIDQIFRLFRAYDQGWVK